MSDRFVSVRQVLQQICICKAELYRRINRGAFPQTIALGPQKVVFLQSEIDEWMKAQIAARSHCASNRRAKAEKAARARYDRKIAS